MFFIATLWVVHFFTIITSVQNVRLGGGGGDGSKAVACFFQNLVMTILFKQNRHFIAFLNVRFWGEGGGLRKEHVLYARENGVKNGHTLSCQERKTSIFTYSLFIL